MNSLLKIRLQVISGDAPKVAALSRSLGNLQKQLLEISKLGGAGNLNFWTHSLQSFAASTKNVNARNLGVLKKTLDGLSQVKLGNLPAAAAAIQVLVAPLAQMSSVVNPKAISSLGSSLRGFAKINPGNLQAAATGLAGMVVPLEAISNTKTTALSRVASNLVKLASVPAGTFADLGREMVMLASGLQQLATRGAAAVPVLMAVGNASRTLSRSTQSGGTSAAASTASFKKAAIGAAGFTLALKGGVAMLGKWSKDLQWVGRQIEYNFTLPLLLAGGLATKFFLDNQKGLTRIVKTYGDVGASADRLSVKFLTLGQNLQSVNRGAMSETEQVSYDMGRALRSLSDIFGTSQADVNALAADWAAAGATGTGLAKSVRSTMEAMVVGDFTDTQEAFQTLITLQQTYKMSSDELRTTLGQLNAIENQTAAQFADLAVGVSKAGASARTAGIDVRHLSAMIAVLTPAAGSAETAGNGLKTIISRLLAPTRAAAETLKEIGINVDSLAWQSQNGTQRLETLARAFDDLNGAQKAVVSADVAGRFQLNRFDLLMEDIAASLDDATRSHSTYQRALDATADSTGDNSAVMRQYRDEIAIFLASTPQGFQILVTRMKNAMSQIITPLIPAIMNVLSLIQQLVQKFANLDPGLQRMILLGLIAMAAVGPIARVTGAVGLLASIILRAFGPAIGLVMGLGKAFAFLFLTSGGWITLAVAAVVAAGIAIYVFRDKVTDALRGVARSFGDLPRAIAGALRAAIAVVAAAARAFFEWLSYLNPFARHSPSIVDQVRAGTALIPKLYAAAAAEAGDILRNAKDDLQAFLGVTAPARRSSELAQRSEQRSQIVSGTPSAGPQVDALYGDLDRLNPLLAELKKQWEDQQKVVDAANQAYADFKDQFDAAQDRISAMNGELSGLRGLYADLVKAGAGSDVLGPINDRIGELERAKSDIQKQYNQKTLDDAKKKAEDEQKRLDDIKKQYDDVEQTIRDIESALSDMAKAAQDAAGALGGVGGGGGGGLGGGGGVPEGGFEVPDTGGLGPENGDLQRLADDWLREAQGAFAGLDPFKVIREKWAQFLAWWNSTIVPWINRVGDFFSGLADDIGSAFGSAKGLLSDAWGSISDAWSNLVDQLNIPDPRDIFKIVDWGAISRSMKRFVDEIKKWMKLEGVSEAVGHVAKFVSQHLRTMLTVAKVILTALVAGWTVAWTVISAVIGPILAFVVDIVTNALAMLRGVIQVVLGIINMEWSQVWDGIKTIFGAAWGSILSVLRLVVDVFKNLWSLLIDAVGKAVGKIGEFLGDAVRSLGDFLRRAGEIVANVVKFFVEMPGKIISAVGDLGGKIWNSISSGMASLPTKIINAATAVINWFAGFGSRIASSMGELGGVLLDAGKQLLQGLWNGAKEVWNRFWNWIQGLPLIGGLIPGGGGGNDNFSVSTFENIKLDGLIAPSARPTLSASSAASTERSLIFNGDLSFPNITSGDDAEAFIRNLEALAGA